MAQNIKVGDVVRYLNSVGGGIVRSFKNKNIILVEEEDGFETPILINEVVVVPPTNQYNFPKEEIKIEVSTAPVPEEVEPEIVIPPYQWNERNETPEGEKLSLYLAFVPVDIKQTQSCDIELYIVNDSNYYIQFALASSDNKATVRYTDCIEPQTKLLIDTISRLSLNDIAHLRLQAFAFKKIGYDIKPTIDAPINIAPIKFFKLHSFVDNDFFDEKALIVKVIENDILNLGSQIDPEEIQRALNSKETKQDKKPIAKTSKPHGEIIEVDLHINQLVDNTAGLTPADMLTLQIDTFHRVMKDNLRHRGQKIVFIHGKGEGVLRAEIEKLLRRQYPHCQYFDASFQQYGFGATQVIIK